MKKFAIFILIFLILIGVFNIEKYILFLTDSMSFLILIMFCFYVLYSKKDILFKELYKEERIWCILFCIGILIDIF